MQAAADILEAFDLTPKEGLTTRPSLIAPAHGLVETKPVLKAGSLVEEIHHLFVNLVEARNIQLPIVSYMEVKLGNSIGTTTRLPHVFTFTMELLQSNTPLVVAVKDGTKPLNGSLVGAVTIDIAGNPRMGGPPRWYQLDGNVGEVMLAMWIGTQDEEVFSDAWHSDSPATEWASSQVYFSPQLCYLSVHIVEAQDIVLSDKSRGLETYVRVQLGRWAFRTWISQSKSVNPIWDEKLIFVTSEPFDELLTISVEDMAGPNKDELLGQVVIPVSAGYHRNNINKPVEGTRWFDLSKPSSSQVKWGKKKETKVLGKIHLGIYLNTSDHVICEGNPYISDLQPLNKQLRKPPIGTLELGILGARNLIPTIREAGGSTDHAYCVAKYGSKWVRTRTLFDTCSPRWNEQYSWEVFDSCTVITVAVFKKQSTTTGSDIEQRDIRIGKIRVRLSTLETDRICTHYYPLLLILPSGIKKAGELQLAIRFTCTAWGKMLSLYGKPLLPEMHYVLSFSPRQADYLRYIASTIISIKLAQATPPLRREVVEYMLYFDDQMYSYVDDQMYSLRRTKSNLCRIALLLSKIATFCGWFDGVRKWKNPVTTVLVHALFVTLVHHPQLILPSIFFSWSVIGLRNFQFRPKHPPHLDTNLSYADLAHPDELDEEFDTFHTSRSLEIVRMRYDRMRHLAGRVQTVVGNLATDLERAQALVSWRDPRATKIFMVLALVSALFLYMVPFKMFLMLAGLYTLRPPILRTEMPCVSYNFFRRLPANSDLLL